MLALDDVGIALMIKERMDSGEWWLLVPCDHDSHNPIIAIESKYYSGDASGDFHAVMVGDPDCPVHAFYFAKKSRMSPEELAEAMIEAGGAGGWGELVERCRTQDIVGFGLTPQTETRGILFVLWAECKAGIREESWEDLVQRLATAVIQDQQEAEGS
jgi:hypothetical protein